jgi:uncharacterized protein involved in exopolysaccharide biosynthesis
MKNQFSTFELIKYIWEKRIILGFVTLIAALGSIVISFMITPMYKSSAIVFATNSISISAALDFQNQYGFNPMFKFGDDEDAEQLIQILKSERIRSAITRKYDLMSHYEIDPGEKYAQAKLANEYYDNVTIKKTAYMSVEVAVMDKDPAVAAQIANDIVALADTLTNEIKRKRAHKALKVIERSYLQQKEKVEESSKMLEKLKSEDITEASIFMMTLYHEKDNLEMLKIRYDEALAEYESDMPFSYVVHKAYPSDMKEYPKKSIIVIVSTLAAFIIALVLLLFKDRWDDFNAKI